MMRPRIGDVVEVQWNDTCTRHGWTHEKETAEFANPIVCVSWGRLLARDKDVVRLASSYAAELGVYNRFEAIPAGCVKKISVLKRYED